MATTRPTDGRVTGRWFGVSLLRARWVRDRMKCVRRTRWAPGVRRVHPTTWSSHSRRVVPWRATRRRFVTTSAVSWGEVGRHHRTAGAMSNLAPPEEARRHRRAPPLAERHGVPRASQAIAATATPTAHGRQWWREAVDGGCATANWCRSDDRQMQRRARTNENRSEWSTETTTATMSRA